MSRSHKRRKKEPSPAVNRQRSTRKSRTASRKSGADRAGLPSNTTRSTNPLWAVSAVICCLVLGIGGGYWLRSRPGTPPPAPLTESVGELGDDSAAATDGPAARNTAPSAVSADDAEQRMAERRFGELFRRGYRNFQAEDYAAATQDFEQAVATAPHLAEGHYYLGETYRKLMYSRKAEDAYRAALARMPDFTPAREKLCMLLYERGAYGEAVSMLEVMLRSKPDDTFALGELAINHLALGDADQAREYLDRYHQLLPRDAWGLARLGRALELQGDLVQAEQRYRESLVIDPYHEVACHWLGLLMSRRGDEAGATKAFARYDRLRKLKNAEHQLRMTLLRDARHVPTLVKLAQTRWALGKRELAIATLKRAQQSAPNDRRLQQLLQQWTRPSG